MVDCGAGAGARSICRSAAVLISWLTSAANSSSRLAAGSGSASCWLTEVEIGNPSAESAARPVAAKAGTAAAASRAETRRAEVRRRRRNRGWLEAGGWASIVTREGSQMFAWRDVARRNPGVCYKKVNEWDRIHLNEPFI